VKVTKYEIETDTMVVSIEKLAQPEGDDRQWIAGARPKDPRRHRPTVFAASAHEAGAQLAAELRKMADAIDKDMKENA
jgi:hypothetical protein